MPMTALTHKLAAPALATLGTFALAGLYAELHRAPDQS
jgi:hypothetical protein